MRISGVLTIVAVGDDAGILGNPKGASNGDAEGYSCGRIVRAPPCCFLALRATSESTTQTTKECNPAGSSR